MQEFNNVLPRIQSTVEKENDKIINFLSVETTKAN